MKILYFKVKFSNLDLQRQQFQASGNFGNGMKAFENVYQINAFMQEHIPLIKLALPSFCRYCQPTLQEKKHLFSRTI